MPTVLRQQGYQIVIFLNDHPPAHVHIRRAGNAARISLQPVELIDNYGFSNREVKQAVEIVQQNQEQLLTAWDNYHPHR